MGQLVEEWCTSSFQGLEIDRFIVRRAMLPMPQKDINPAERPRLDGGLM
jgi:hypothetical protein